MSEESASPSQIKISWLVGVVAAFAIFWLIGVYSARMTRNFTDYDEQRAAQRVITLKKVQDAENKLLYPVDKAGKPTAVWVDAAKGTVNISIDEAMSKEVDTLKSQPAAIGNEINPPAAAPAPAPAAAETNAAPAKPAEPAPAKPAPPKKAKK